jgi:hypothetical protein
MSQKSVIVWEQLSLWVTALPCPPLPVMVKMRKNAKNKHLKDGEEEEEDAEEEEEEGYASSHDLLAGLLVMAMERGKTDLNEARRTKQMQLTSELITTLEKAAETQAPAATFYAACVRFTAEYVHAFNDPGQGTPMVRFVGMEHVVPGDKVHKACCSWSAAQDIQHETVEARRRNATEWGMLGYPELLMAHGRRVVAV